jgi:hypothetical protein
MKRRTAKDKANMGLKSKEFYFLNGIVYQNSLDAPDSDYYPIRPKGKQIPLQSFGCLAIPKYNAG